MFRKLFKLSLAGLLFLNICGFAFIAASVADSQKIKQTFDVSYGDGLVAVKDALKASSIRFKKADINETTTQVRARYDDGTAVRIWIYKLSDSRIRIEVRVGTSENDMPQSQKLMDAIALCMPNK
ncbi:MAG: DUF3568 family protein [Candidatus Omnitrophica bacterium]|nr:DUF3568 family protein [Candidatus Omnitrophota bacterium]